MGELYTWVRNITFYLVLVSVLTNLLPSRKYEKYMRLFLGMIMILLIIQPITGSLRLEERIAYYFSSINFHNQAEDLEKELIGAEQQRLEQMIAQYEAAVGMDLEQMVKAAGLYPVYCQVVIGKEPEKQEFGKVTQIKLTVSAHELERDSKNPLHETEDTRMQPVYEVEPVDIQKIGKEGEDQPDTGQSETEGNSDTLETQNGLRTLRRKICEYYSLEEAYVEIQLENG